MPGRDESGSLPAALLGSLQRKLLALCGTISGRSNNSLDASGVSGLLIHNLSVAQSSAAASTQPLYALSDP
jgi:hypothetical protein